MSEVKIRSSKFFTITGTDYPKYVTCPNIQSTFDNFIDLQFDCHLRWVM